MTLMGWIEIAVFFAIVVAITPVLGAYITRVFTGQPVLLSRVLGPFERGIYKAIRADVKREQSWKVYAACVMLFSLAGWLLLYLILRTQTIHPFNPQGFHSAPWNVTFNTVTSFLTNTNWQYYGGETTMSYFSQMAGLTVQNFVSAAVGICVAVALIRGRRRQGTAACPEHHGPGRSTLGDHLGDRLQRPGIPALIPLSLKGVRYRPIGANALLRRNMWIYGLGGLITPFIGIKLIDLIVHNLLGA